VNRAALVVNPTKQADPGEFRAMVGAVMAEHGWSEPLWLETTAGEPGVEAARTALRSGADLVLACGGDGTVTACAAGVAGSGVPLGVLPMGTGNLLARNVGVPLDLGEALAAALTGVIRPLDVGTANGKPFVVMAGVGFDAKMLGGASEELKKRLGWGAYVVSALAHLRDRPMRVRLRADGAPVLRRRASGVVIGNVGWLQGGLPLLPDAVPDDGLLDVIVLSARGWAEWLALAGHVLLRRRASGRLARLAFRELRLDLERAHPWELDGEVMGSTRQLVVTVQAGALLLRVPATPRPAFRGPAQ
jgi:YegS/Rv2252/BmrU family lipid kinase